MFLILASVLLAAVMTDLRCFQIPNLLTIPAMVIGLLMHALERGQAGLVMSLEGLATGLILFLIPYMVGGMGAGDVKLMGAVGSFLGPEGVVSAVVMAMLLGGVYAAVLMVSHWGLQESVNRIKSTFVRTARFQTPIPTTAQNVPLRLRYALVIGLGTILSQLGIVR